MVPACGVTGKEDRVIGRVLFWGGVILAVLWVVHHPLQASNDVNSVGTFLSVLMSR